MCQLNKVENPLQKQPFEYNTFLKLHSMTMGQHFFAIFGALDDDKHRKEWLLTIFIAFFYLIVKT